jgi:hypothetical protein
MRLGSSLDHWPGQITSGKDELKTKFLLPLFNAFPDLKWVSLEGISSTFRSIFRRCVLVCPSHR